MKYFWYGTMNAFFFVVGLWVGGIMCGLQPPRYVPNDCSGVFSGLPKIYPSPRVYFEGKRSEPGKMSPEMERRIELQKIFNGVPSQDVNDGPPGLDAPWKVKK